MFSFSVTLSRLWFAGWRPEVAPLKSERLFRLPAMETYKTCGNPYGFPKPMFFFASLTPFFPLPATSQ